MNNYYDFIIVGSGIVGSSLALALQQKNFSVAIIDKNHNTRISNRIYAINHQTQNFWQTLGLTFNGNDYNHMEVWGHKTSAHISFSNNTLEISKLGTILEEKLILEKLKQSIAHSTISCYQETVLNINKKNDWIVTTPNTHLRSKWLIAADGANSFVREHLNIKTSIKPYYQTSITASVKCDKLHRDTAYQSFCEQGIIALLPLNNSNECSLVWSAKNNIIDELSKLDDLAFNQMLSEFFFHKLGHIKIISKREYFPLVMRQAQKIISHDRWLLLGDAAHTFHPLAGIGLNQGIADLILFIKSLNKNLTNFITNSDLGNYARTRKFEIWRTIEVINILNKLFLNSNLLIQIVRNLGINTVDKIDFIKKWLIYEACGVDK